MNSKRLMVSTWAKSSLVSCTIPSINDRTSGLFERSAWCVDDTTACSPVADGVVLDAYQRGQVFAAVSDHHRFAHERRHLQAILDFRRGNVFPPAVMMMSFLRSVILR